MSFDVRDSVAALGIVEVFTKIEEGLMIIGCAKVSLINDELGDGRCNRHHLSCGRRL
jgi:hypothetical protein